MAWILHLETIQCLGMFCNITLIIVSKPADVYIVSVQVHYLTNESITHIRMYVGIFMHANMLTCFVTGIMQLIRSVNIHHDCLICLGVQCIPCTSM